MKSGRPVRRPALSEAFSASQASHHLDSPNPLQQTYTFWSANLLHTQRTGNLHISHDKMTQNSPLLRLPQELLDKILDFAALQPNPILIDRKEDTDDVPLYTKTCHSLLSLALTCRPLSTSYLASLYSTNTFSFPSTSNHAFQRFHAQIGPANAKRLASLDFGYNLSDDDWRTLQQTTCANAIRRLSLYFGNNNWAPPRPDDIPLDDAKIQRIEHLSHAFPSLRSLTIEVKKYDFECPHGPWFGRFWDSVEAAVAEVRAVMVARSPKAAVTLLETNSYRAIGDPLQRDERAERVARVARAMPGEYSRVAYRHRDPYFDSALKRMMTREEAERTGYRCRCHHCCSSAALSDLLP